MPSHPFARHAAPVLFVLAVLAAAPAPLRAQSGRSDEPALEPPRPRLDAGADTNDAEPYLELARRLLGHDSQRAAAAAYWATRIDPTSARALLVRGEAEGRAAAWRHMRSLTLEERRRIDSIYVRAMARDPFVSIEESVDPRYLPPLAAVRTALEQHPEALPLRVYLAGRFFALQQFDSTIAEMRATLAALEKLDRDRPPVPYQSREVFHYAIAKALFASGRRDEARDEFSAALGENVAFYPAHAALGSIAWTQWNDLPKAREEFGLALELHDDGVTRYDYGTILLLASQPAEAAAQFDRAVALEPYFASARFNRAVALDRLGKRGEAVAAYRDFIDRAPRRSAELIAAARGRIDALSAPADSASASHQPR